MNDYDLNEKNFLILAMKAYDRPHCIMSEFAEDYKRVKYIKRLIGKYLISGDIKERLILNHLIILSNVFGVDFTTRMLFLKLEENHYPAIKTFLVFLNYLPETIHTINGKIIYTNDIYVDSVIAQKLRTI